MRPFRFARLSALGIPHGVTKRDPSLPAFGSVSGNATISIVLANRRAWWERLGLPLEHTVFARQVHGTRVTVVTASERGCGALEPGTGIPESDALVTTERNLPLAMICADCVPGTHPTSQLSASFTPVGVVPWPELRDKQSTSCAHCFPLALSVCGLFSGHRSAHAVTKWEKK